MTLRSEDQLPARRHSLVRVDTYEVERHQFDRIEREASGIGTAFAMSAACLPVAITLNITLLSVTFKNPKTATAFWGLTFACYLVGILCALQSWRQRGELRRFMAEIRDSQVAPIASKEEVASPDLTAVSDPAAAASVATQPDNAEER